MSHDIIQANYDTLEEVAQTFAEAAQGIAEMLQEVRGGKQNLEGDWVGLGSDAFFSEMDDEVLPATARLQAALADASGTTRRISTTIRAAEEAAAALFQGDASGPLPNGTLVGGIHASGPTPLSGSPSSYLSGFGYGSPSTIMGDGYAPTLPWATAPFAAGASTLGPGPVPLLGMPNKGKPLWLYYGGQGKHTIFSIHPHAGWGRARRHDSSIPKPRLRLDYGLLQSTHPDGNALMPNTRRVYVSRTNNFFHWNQKGFNYLFEVSDHQLLSRPALQQPNVLGPISGANLVRYGSRGLFVVGAGLDVYSVATADNKAEEGVRRAAAWGGAWAGTKAGATGGAFIGGLLGGPPGAAIGGVIGGIGGGIAGYMGGYEIGDELYELGHGAVDQLGDFVGGAGERLGDFASGAFGGVGDWF